MCDHDKLCMKLIFKRSAGVSERTKIKDFWDFLNTANNFHPYIPVRDDESIREKTSGLNASERERHKRNTIWHDRLKTLQEVGLDKVALAADDSCHFCRTHRASRATREFADTVQESYQELNNEMNAFDARSHKN